MKSRQQKKKNKKKSIELWLLPVLWAGVIFTLSSIQTIKVAEIFFWDFLLKKGAHVFEYTILFILIFRASRKNWFLTYAICIIYALSDEFHQSFVPGRTASILDIAFDISGMNIASYTLWKYYPSRHEKLKK